MHKAEVATSKQNDTAFDFDAVAIAMRKKLVKMGTKNTEFVDATSCRLRWCGLDYLRYKQTVVESPTKSPTSSSQTEEPAKAEKHSAPPLPAEVVAALGETNMDELD